MIHAKLSFIIHIHINMLCSLSLPDPVSFSIKAKEEPSVPIRAALPQEASSDEEEQTKNDGIVEAVHHQTQPATPSIPIIIVPEPLKAVPAILHPIPITNHHHDSLSSAIAKAKSISQNRNSSFEELNDSQIRDALFEPSHAPKQEEKKDTKRGNSKILPTL